MSVTQISANDLINAVAQELKKNPVIKPPEWATAVKSGASRERLPEQEDFWYLRCSSLLRTLYFNPSVGVQKLRHKYGGKKRHYMRRPHHKKAGGKAIRLALQQLEKAGLIKKEKFGRTLTKEGINLLKKSASK